MTLKFYANVKVMHVMTLRRISNDTTLTFIEKFKVIYNMTL